jgi:PAS domain S-box-containing protein
MADAVPPASPWCIPLLQAMPDGVAYTVGNLFVFVNDAFAKITGIPVEKLLGLNAFSLLDEDERKRVQERYAARLRGENPTDSYEVEFVRRDGTRSRVRMEPRVLGPTEALILIRDLGPYHHERKLLADLGALAVTLQRARSVPAVLEAATQGLKALEFEVAALRVSEGQGFLIQHAVSDDFRAVAEVIAASPIKLGRIPGVLEAQQSQAPVYIDDALTALEQIVKVEGRPLQPSLLANLRERRQYKLMVAPVFVQGQPWGFLLVSASVLSSKDAAALSLFAAQIGSALEAAQHMEELERQNSFFLALHRVVLETSEVPEAELTSRILPSLEAATQSDGVAIYLRNAEGDGLVLAESTGTPGWFVEKYSRLPMKKSVTGHVAVSNEPRSLRLEDWPPAQRVDVSRVGMLHTAILPLVRSGHLSGTINLMRKTDRPYSSEELRSASLLAAQLAVQVERAQLILALRKSYDLLAKAQQDLVKQERLAALGELAAVVAHEVRNPLGVIFNSLASLRRIPQDPTSARLLDYLSEESERLNRLVGELLDFARPHTAKLKAQSVQELVTGALESTGRTGLVSGVRIDSDIPGDLPRVMVDSQLMRQALVNLLVNGAQAMPGGGELKVQVRAEVRGAQPMVRIDVSDSGQGIPNELTGQIFQPFFTTKATGTGLGLALVKRITDAHRAEISVHSTLGEGTTFSLWLPVELPAS